MRWGNPGHNRTRLTLLGAGAPLRGLDPLIHVFAAGVQGVGGRVEPGQGDFGYLDDNPKAARRASQFSPDSPALSRQ
ncbi:MAG TPA: hypothetical protein VFQ82_10365 [Stellaceae bacterium]|nr:hypothetical protein [Stellaceae bacterium]